MHDRNVFKLRPPNYEELSKKYPEFRAKCFIGAGGKICVNFCDPEAVRLLTVLLLFEYFELRVQIPIGSLVPRVPQRLNYILLLEDIISRNDLDSGSVWGIDIGTGTSCIYPLLGTTLNKWSFVATEVDESSICSAQQNIRSNNQEERIRIIHSADNSVFKNVFSNYLYAEKQFTFSMCNPPFFDPEEISQKFVKSAGKNTMENYSRMDTSRVVRLPPRSATTATTHEIIYPGGETSFVTRMVEESIDIGGKICVYTTMIGQLASLRYLKSLLRQNGIRHSVHLLSQGKTTRWVLVWTFHDHFQI